jgi:subtilisin family serine protease
LQASPLGTGATALLPDTVPDDPRYGDLWGMAKIRAPQAWDLSTGDPDLVVAIIDTGIDYTHPDLAANIWTNPGEIPANSIDDDGNGYVDDVHGYDFYNNDGDPMDDHFHGTHVAGTTGAVGNNGVGVAGVNWHVRLMALKFLASSGSGPVSGAIGALEYAARMGARISNNSWGSGAYSQALYDAIKNAQVADHLFVAAAGNSYANADTQPTYPAAYDLDNIISVAAMDKSDGLAAFSNWGVRTVDLGAPGVSILSSVLGGGYASYSGTSMATPHVAGAAALLYALHPDWGYAQAREQLLATTRAVPALLGRTVTGGVLDSYNAMSNNNPGPIPTPGPTPTPPPPPPPPPFVSYALADLPVEGRDSGSYQDTWRLDGVTESIIERNVSGPPSTRYDQLEHAWQFWVATGRPHIVFRVVAWAPPSSDADSMVFEYSADRVNWSTMLTVTAKAQTRDSQEYVLPPEAAGRTIYVRVRDTNRTPPSWKANDTVYVDYMAITSAAK